MTALVTRISSSGSNLVNRNNGRRLGAIKTQTVYGFSFRWTVTNTPGVQPLLPPYVLFYFCESFFSCLFLISSCLSFIFRCSNDSWNICFISREAVYPVQICCESIYVKTDFYKLSLDETRTSSFGTLPLKKNSKHKQRMLIFCKCLV